MSWQWIEKWNNNDPYSLPRYASPNAYGWLKERFSINPDAYNRDPDGRRELVQSIYETLRRQRINYRLEESMDERGINQTIRHPSKVLIHPREGTCLDLSLVFCGLCISARLLPWIVLVRGHAFVAISLLHGWEDWQKPRDEWEDFLYQEDNRLRLLEDPNRLNHYLSEASDRYMVVECTGYADSRGVLDGSEEPEALHRDEAGLLSFDEALRAGQAQLSNPRRPLLYAIDLLVAQRNSGIEPFKEPRINSEKDTLPFFLRQVVADHQSIVPPILGEQEALPLAEVYVELDLLSVTRRIQNSQEREWASRPHPLHEYVEASRRQCDWCTNRWIVRGGPGSGKTTALRSLALQLAEEWLQGEAVQIPILLGVTTLATDRKNVWSRVAQRAYRTTGSKGIAAALKSAATDGNVVFLLDGLDEVPMRKRSDARDVISGLSTQFPKSTIITTTRPIGEFPISPNFVELDLLPLPPEGQRSLVERVVRSTGGESEAVYGKVLAYMERPDLNDLTSTPLFLTVVALLAASLPDAPTSRSALMSELVTLLLERPGRDTLDAFALPRPRDCRRFLQFIGYELTRRGRLSASVEVILMMLEKRGRAILSALEKVPRWRGAPERMLRDLADSSGILAPYDGPGREWRFWHKAVQESLAAEYLSRKVKIRGYSCLEKPLTLLRDGDTRWAESLALIAGHIKSSRLVLDLAQANPSLGIEALRNSASISTTAADCLLRSIGSATARAQVLDCLLGRVKDTAQLVDLLDRFRRQTTDGNDLYFVHTILNRIKSNLPNIAKQAVNARTRLFDHLTLLEPTSFVTIVTRAGVEPLWVRISAGEYERGSSSPESHGDESPPHRVKISKPFWIMCTPVTNAMYQIFNPNHSAQVWPGLDQEMLAMHPVVNVSWYEAMAFALWLGGRIPTEAEWEFVCRAGTSTQWFSGDTAESLTGYAHHRAGDENSGTKPVGSYRPNPIGLYDVVGNVWEWCYDWYSPYTQENKTDPQGPPGGLRKVLRGGGFWNDAHRMRSSFRSNARPADGAPGTGFRVVIDCTANLPCDNAFGPFQIAPPACISVMPGCVVSFRLSIPPPLQTFKSLLTTLVPDLPHDGYSIRLNDDAAINYTGDDTQMGRLVKILADLPPERLRSLEANGLTEITWSGGEGWHYVLHEVHSLRPSTLSSPYLYVGNLPSNLTRNDLILLFEPFGTIRVVNLMTDELTGVNLGFGYVEFESSEAARNAALKLDNVPLRLALQAESTGFANSYVRIKVNVTRQMRYPDGEMSWVR